MAIKDIAPYLTPEECEEAERNLRDVIDVLLIIHKDLRADPERYAEFKRLTTERHRRKRQ